MTPVDALAVLGRVAAWAVLAGVWLLIMLVLRGRAWRARPSLTPALSRRERGK